MSKNFKIRLNETHKQFVDIITKIEVESRNLDDKIESQFEFVEDEVEVYIESLKAELDLLRESLKIRINEAKDKMKSSLRLDEIESDMKRYREELLSKKEDCSLVEELKEKSNKMEVLLNKLKTFDHKVTFVDNNDFKINEDSICSFYCNYDTAVRKQINKKIQFKLLDTTRFRIGMIEFAGNNELRLHQAAELYVKSEFYGDSFSPFLRIRNVGHIGYANIQNSQDKVKFSYHNPNRENKEDVDIIYSEIEEDEFNEEWINTHSHYI